jgi:acetylglutamate kinase
VPASPPTPDAIRAEHLTEALPYILRYRGATVAIKFGGHAMLSEPLIDAFARDVTLLRLLGLKPVVVHGGGPQISQTLSRLNIETRFVEGLRYTDSATMEVVEMVLGAIGKDLVCRVGRAGGAAVGLSGKDASLIFAVKKEIQKPAKDPGEPFETVDIGLVGTPVAVNVELLESLARGDFIPIIAPVGTDVFGSTFNVNADTAASAIAVALKARRLILLTDVEGVLDSAGKLIPTLSEAEIAEMSARGLITGGMIPKLECCLEALRDGCESASIIDGRVPHSLLLEIFTHKGSGTEIVLGEREFPPA